MKNLDIQTYEDTFLDSPLYNQEPFVQPSINVGIRTSMIRCCSGDTRRRAVYGTIIGG